MQFHSGLRRNETSGLGVLMFSHRCEVSDLAVDVYDDREDIVRSFGVIPVPMQKPQGSLSDVCPFRPRAGGIEVDGTQKPSIEVDFFFGDVLLGDADCILQREWRRILSVQKAGGQHQEKGRR
jgi:hypothetical protein